MGSIKTLGKKARLSSVRKKNRRVPAWVMQRTNRRFQRHPKRYHWRKASLKRA